MNAYLKNLNKIEFVVTSACSGNCKHCSQGEHRKSGESVDAAVAVRALEAIASVYDIKTVMCFGGEPLLCADTVYAIMEAATKMNIPGRQVITNGFFTKDDRYMHEVAHKLFLSGVNDLLLSADAFHQEGIPLDRVMCFAELLRKCSVPVRIQPAWLVSPCDDNPYNLRTKEILDGFRDIGIYENEGNIIFPEGNALKYLSEYFTETKPQNPYTENPYDLRCISFDSNGDVLGGNIYHSDIYEIIRNYKP